MPATQTLAPPARHRSSSPRRRTGPLAAVVGVGLLLATTADAALPPTPVGCCRAAESPTVRAAEVVRAWDARRATAYATGDAALLRSLYVGRAGRRDLAVLEGYRRRGLRVEGLRVQLLAVEVRSSRPRSIRAVVTDRVAGGTMVRPAAGLRPAWSVALPRDRASTREVRLVRPGAGWQVAAVDRVESR